jgi:hypothetical protein
MSSIKILDRPLGNFEYQELMFLLKEMKNTFGSFRKYLNRIDDDIRQFNIDWYKEVRYYHEFCESEFFDLLGLTSDNCIGNYKSVRDFDGYNESEFFDMFDYTSDSSKYFDILIKNFNKLQELPYKKFPKLWTKSQKKSMITIILFFSIVKR